MKNTPPLTPRALSNDGSESVHLSSALDNHNGQQHAGLAADEQSGSRTAPPIGPPKGKLYVQVISARGLRPSISPYAVCSFEWIESIAHGPQLNGTENDLSPPINKAGNDIGRSIAIPMRSRQSSTTSLSDQKSFRNSKQVTEPAWHHEAVLFVSPSTQKGCS